jgi:hypothetical protein
MLVNTREFSRGAQYFKKNGVYVDAPAGTKDYKDFWYEETRRSIQGYKVGDLWITGKHYFYLNYCPIEVVPDYVLANKNWKGEVVKELDLPKFWEIDLEWWNAKHEAANRPLGEGNHLVCLKTRGCGFSYKEASDGVHIYNFFPKSKTFYFASDKEYLIGDGILSKVDIMMGHLNKHTAWKKNRQAKDSMMHKRASYYTDELKNTEKGFLSEIQGVVIPGHNPDKVRGKRGKKVTFEEAGSFKNIKSGWQISREGIEQGGFLTGQMSAFGTGGEEGEDIEGLDEIFNDPDTFNCLAFDNKWLEIGSLDVIGDTANFSVPEQYLTPTVNSPSIKGNANCGFFVPCVAANDKYMDEEGNILMKESFEFELKERVKLKKAKDIKTKDRKVAERPFVPDEALHRFHGNDLPALEAKEQIKRIQASQHIQGMIKYGQLTYSPKVGIKFKLTDDKPIVKYPHSNKDNLNGCISICETPYKRKDSEGKLYVPNGLYIILVDPYAIEDAEDKTSLGAVYVFKRQNNFTGSIGELLVAWYVARPRKLATFYNNVEKLSDYYNATVQSEIAGGGQGLHDHFKAKRKLHMLEFEPDMLHNKEMASNQKNKSYFMKMPTDRKALGILYFADWLIEEIGIDERGNPILRIHKIYDVGLLTEISKFNVKRNADRVSAMILAMYMLKEKNAIELKEKKAKSSFWNRPLYQDRTGNRKIDGDMFVLD